MNKNKTYLLKNKSVPVASINPVVRSHRELVQVHDFDQAVMN